jgi:hypothetical protein
MEAIPNVDAFFRVGRFVGGSDKTMRQLHVSTVLECWEKWFTEALDALRILHSHGFVHGCLDLHAFRIDDQKTLRIGNLSSVRKVEDPLPLEAFRAENLTFPPEVLFQFGREEGDSFSTLYGELKGKNSMFELFPPFFPSMLLRQSFERCFQELDTVDPRKSDVWMLANTFFRFYVDLLSNPKTMSSEFYVQKHDSFKKLLGPMLHPVPSVRPTAEVCLQNWGYNYAQTEPEPEPEPKELKQVNSVSETASVSASVYETSNSDPPKKPRLVLTSGLGPAGRNKTRKNLRN